MARESMPTAIELFTEPATGIVQQTITATQKGRIRFQASYWPARLHDPQATCVLEPGMPVKVLGRDNIVLLVAPASLSAGQVSN